MDEVLYFAVFFWASFLGHRLARYARWRHVLRPLVAAGFRRKWLSTWAADPEQTLRLHLEDGRLAGHHYVARLVKKVPYCLTGFTCVSVAGRGDSKLWPGDPSPTGDPIFDAHFGVFGPPLAWVPVLDATTRALLLELPGDFIRISGAFEVNFRKVPPPELVQKAVQTLRALAEHLRAPGHAFQQLGEMVLHDPMPRVRSNCLRVLRSDFPDDLGTLRIAQAAIADPEPVVRLQAAVLLKAKDQICDIAVDRGVPVELRKAALGRLTGKVAPEDRTRLLPLLREPELGGAPWRVIAEQGGVLDLADLPELLPLGDLATVEAAAACLGLVGAAAEPQLLNLLADQDPDVAAAAAQVLGRVGTVRSIGPLRARRPPFLGPPRLKRLIEEALARLEPSARLHGGNLALADDSGGGLSVADAHEQSSSERAPR